MTRLEEQNVLLLLYLIYFDYCEIILTVIYLQELSVLLFCLMIKSLSKKWEIREERNQRRKNIFEENRRVC